MSNSQSTIKAVTMDMCKTAKEMSPESFSELVIHSGNEDSSDGHCTGAHECLYRPRMTFTFHVNGKCFSTKVEEMICIIFKTHILLSYEYIH